MTIDVILLVRNILERHSIKTQFINYFKSSFRFRFLVAAFIAVIIGALMNYVLWTHWPLEIAILFFVGYLIFILIKDFRQKRPISRWYVFEICFWIFISMTLFIEYLLIKIL